MPFNWNQQADTNLLAQILHMQDLKLNYTSLSVVLGGGLTPNAVRQRIIKLKQGQYCLGAGETGISPATEVTGSGGGKGDVMGGGKANGGKVGKGGGGKAGTKASPKKRKLAHDSDGEIGDEVRVKQGEVNWVNVGEDNGEDDYDGAEDDFALLRQAAGMVVGTG